MGFLAKYGLDFPHLFVMFIIFAFLGWCCEEVYVSSLQRKLVKRGMLYGPICPIYGFGGLIIYFCLYPWRDTWFILFLAAFVLTSTLEYFSSWILEKLFHAKWWDYSKRAFNLNGRCCLLNSTLFGLMGIAAEHWVEPFVHKLIYLPEVQPYFEYIAIALAVILTTDILFTIRKLVDFNATMVKFKEFGEQMQDRFADEEWFQSKDMHSMLKSIKEKAAAEKGKFTESFLEKVEQFSRQEKSVGKMIKKFPTMTSKDYSSILEHVRQSLVEYAEEQKKLIKADAEAISGKINKMKEKKNDADEK